MLPFLKSKKDAAVGLIVKTRAPDEKPQDEQEEQLDSDAAMEACASELIRAIHSRDAKAVALALKDILDTMPSEELEERSDYDAQNIKAAQEQD